MFTEKSELIPQYFHKTNKSHIDLSVSVYSPRISHTGVNKLHLSDVTKYSLGQYNFTPNMKCIWVINKSLLQR
jgi:hypothetical protein